MSDDVNANLDKLRADAGAVLHPDQTSKEPVVWRCHNPPCGPLPGLPMPFDFKSDYPVCPKCGSNGLPNVHKRALIHLLVPDARGPIQGQHSRLRVACDPTRITLATLTNGEAMTGVIGECNCESCLRAVITGKAEVQEQHFTQIVREEKPRE